MKNDFKKTHSFTQEYIEFIPNIHLRIGKIHEICGPAKTRIVTLVGAKTKGLIVWIRPEWEDFIINVDGISPWFSPNQLLLINAKSKNDLFFATEEVLRSGIPELTIIELPGTPNSLQMRRMHLGINAGIKLNHAKKPIALILSPNKGGATNIESRWYASTLPCWKQLLDNEDGNLKQKWYLKRLFSRTHPIKKWSIETIDRKQSDVRFKLVSLPMT